MFNYLPLGDSVLLIKIGTDISVQVHRQVSAMANSIDNARIDGIIELVPAYNELMVVYNPRILNIHQLTQQLKKIEGSLVPGKKQKKNCIYIPVCYDDEFAPDMDWVAQSKNLSKKEIVELHTSPRYLVYMLGFTPGFCYLGGLSPRLSIPRKESPRPQIKAGSVGLADQQTGIYPLDSPGGWQIIGQTPLKLFDPGRDPVFIINASDFLYFFPVNKREFVQISEEVLKGKYILKQEMVND